MILHYLKTYWISALLCITILVLCMMNTEPLPEAPMTDFDKLVHVIMFMGLSGTVFLDSTRYFRKSISLRRLFWGCLFFPALFGGVIEIMQEYLTASRSGDWMDFVFDTVGTAIGWSIGYFINERWLLERK